MAVRLPLVESSAKDVAGERQLLTRLAPLLPVAIRVPLGEGMPAEDYPWHWSVYRWLAGETVDGRLSAVIASREGPAAGRLSGVQLVSGNMKAPSLGPLTGKGMR